jgi:hypothetical protein
MNLHFLIHASGMTALAINASGLARSSDASLRTKTGVASALWALNNFYMGAYSAAALSALTVGRQATASAVCGASTAVRDLSCTAFLLLTWATGACTWQGPQTVFTTLGSTLATYAMFYWSGSRLRVAMVLVSALWMYNAWAYHSWWQAAANVLAAAAAVYGAWRLRQRPQPVPASD